MRGVADEIVEIEDARRPLGIGISARISLPRAQPGGKAGIAILAFGTLAIPALRAGQALDATVVDMRFVKPIDRELILDLASRHAALVTVEEGSIMGGAGSAVCEVLNEAGTTVPVMQLGLPDRFIDHGEQGALLAGLGLDAAGIERSVRERFPDQVS